MNNTQFEYEFHHTYDSVKQLTIMRKYERIAKDTPCHMSVKVIEDSKGIRYANILIGVKSLYPINDASEYITLTFQYTEDDKQLYCGDYEKIRDNYGNDDNPFYTHPIYHVLDYMYNGAGKFTDLYNAIQFVRMIEKILNKE